MLIKLSATVKKAKTTQYYETLVYRFIGIYVTRDERRRNLTVNHWVSSCVPGVKRAFME